MKDNMSQPEEYTAQNRRAWDEIAEIRQKKWQPAEFFTIGGYGLSDRVLTVASNVSGSRLCHPLKCPQGTPSGIQRKILTEFLTGLMKTIIEAD